MGALRAHDAAVGPPRGAATASARVSCRALEGDLVADPGGREIGRLARVMLELRTGRICTAVIACGGVLGIGERHYGVPWSKLSYDPERRLFVLDA